MQKERKEDSEIYFMCASTVVRRSSIIDGMKNAAAMQRCVRMIEYMFHFCPRRWWRADRREQRVESIALRAEIREQRAESRSAERRAQKRREWRAENMYAHPKHVLRTCNPLEFNELHQHALVSEICKY